MVTAGWNRVFLDELAGFPSGAHDDQVDAASDAFSGLISRPAMVISQEALRRI
jgi:predicted phage terminase large subunit-like protein